MSLQGHFQLSLKGHGDQGKLLRMGRNKLSLGKDLGNYRVVNLTLVPGKKIDEIILKTISKHIKTKKVIWSSQQGFLKG